LAKCNESLSPRQLMRGEVRRVHMYYFHIA
jgi:hypothetical protein